LWITIKRIYFNLEKYKHLEISILKFSEVLEDNESFRIDSEYYKKEYLNSYNILKKCEYQRLHKISNTKGGKRLPIGEHFITEGIPYIRAEDIRNSFVNYENSPKISIELHNKLKKYQTKYNDVLLTIVGNSIGDIGIVKFNLDKCNLTENAAKIVNLKLVKPDCLFIFLLSEYGQIQIRKEKVGTAQPKLALERIKKFIIPIFSPAFQSKIEELVKTSYNKLKESKELYKKAENLLLEELGLKDFKPSEENIAIKSFKESFLNTGRLDAEYYQPKYEEIIEKIKSYRGGWDYLGNIVNWKKGIEVGSKAYQENGKGFLRVSDISKFGIENISKKISDELYEELKNEFKPKIGDILFTKDGTIGISYVVKENIEAIVSGAFLRLTLKENYKNFSKETLSLIFNSIVSKMQVEKLSGGALIAHLKPSDFEKFVIPIINNNTQTQIENLIQTSFKLKKESKELLYLAVKVVEVAIEKNENIGMRFLKEVCNV